MRVVQPFYVQALCTALLYSPAAPRPSGSALLPHGAVATRDRLPDSVRAVEWSDGICGASGGLARLWALMRCGRKTTGKTGFLCCTCIACPDMPMAPDGGGDDGVSRAERGSSNGQIVPVASVSGCAPPSTRRAIVLFPRAGFAEIVECGGGFAGAERDRSYFLSALYCSALPPRCIFCLLVARSARRGARVCHMNHICCLLAPPAQVVMTRFRTSPEAPVLSERPAAR